MLAATTSLAVLLGSALGWGQQSDQPADSDKGVSGQQADRDAKTEQEWLEIGDRLADEKKYKEALIAYKNAYETIVGRFRGRPFKQPVQPRFMTRPELQEYMLKEFKKEISPEEMRFMDRSLKVFGYAPADLDVEETLLKLYTEEVAGFYNPRTKEMFLIREEPKQGTLGIFRKLVGMKDFDKDEQKTTLAHEMTHALADQYYDLQAMTDASSDNDDVAMAISALIEGEATLLMLGEMLSDDRDEADIWLVRGSQVEATFGFAASAAMVFGGRTMRNAPAIFRKTLIFPYHKGTVFTVELGQNSDWSRIDRAFTDPPLSTEQILHPEKYLGEERDVPTAIEFPSSAERLGPKWNRLGDNSLGELQIQILFSEQREGKKAAAGWDGDRFEVYEHKQGHLGLAWYTVWDSKDDAAQFASTYGRYNEDRYAKEAAGDDAAPKYATKQVENGSMFQMERGEQRHVVRIRGNDVLIVDGFNATETAIVLEQLEQAQQSPLTLDLKAAAKQGADRP